MERALEQGIARIERAIARGATYEDVVTAVDDCAALANADAVAPALAGWRITAALAYERPAPECEAALDALLAIPSSLLSRATDTLAVCATHPALAEKYLPALIAELDAQPCDDSIASMLATATRLLTASIRD